MKQRLRAGEIVYGTWVRIPHPVVVEVVGRSGVDFLHIDMEHAPIGTGEVDRMLLAAKTIATPAIVRVPGLDEATIGRVLDLGAAGVIVPKINSGEDAKRAIQAARFYPQGLRGLGGACRADGYGGQSFTQFATSANEQTLLALQIESKQAVERIDEILEIAGDAVDVFYIGPADLSQSLGVPGQFDDPLLRETIQWVVRRIQKRGKVVGIHVPSLEMVKGFTDLGIRYITCSFDLGVLSSGAKQLAQLMKQSVQ